MKLYMLAIVPALVLSDTSYKATVSLYQDTACQTPVVGSGNTVVDGDTCDTGPFETGWSSAQVVNAADLPSEGTITFYTKNNCGCPSCGSHGYAAQDSGCLTDFGFSANAVGFDAAPV
ncbi:hypothetical protein M409DRAFT_28628 [Zasmidium cellare ATCC 36951]|uniref:Uncharacterized protein n=1 Tax=Zasmidium cellare ATCC 36951 TaxID=1080233 RepID=A0A6A6C1X2_ZASCE|nr:uncharacterized protein M409DRAFT_28628 [Zasmidium cellare ATCC 36951]KAF2161021.1 hypothetical protein M409DRAFT_28628 [Zasmidium cellare ATCC 36951]